MDYQNFILEVKQNVAYLQVNRPQVHNAMNADCWRELIEIIKEVDSSPEIRALVISGSGSKAFVSGADINFLKDRTSVSAMEGLAQSALDQLSKLGKPTIAAVNGLALGAGCELALACDIRIAAEHAKFGLPETGLGILPGAGGTQRLARIVGQGRAVQMIFTGCMVSAQHALMWGQVSFVVPGDDLLPAAADLAARILQKAPLAIRLAKKAITASTNTDMETGLLLELLSYSALMSSKDKEEGVNAFLEKRVPQFTGE